jgi:hypothetical protein
MLFSDIRRALFFWASLGKREPASADFAGRCAG